MSDNRNKDYLNYIFRRTVRELRKYNVDVKEFQTLREIINKLLRSENLMKDLYILHHIKEFRNSGKYLIYILKKLDDNVITFDNLTQNVKEDTEFLEKEFLNYLFADGNKAALNVSKKVFDLQRVTEDDTYETEEKVIDVVTELQNQEQSSQIIEEEEDEEMLTFKQNYMELIQSEEENENAAFELPGMEDLLSGGEISKESNSNNIENTDSNPESDLPELSSEKETADPESDLPGIETNGEIKGQKSDEIKNEITDEIKNEITDEIKNEITDEEAEEISEHISEQDINADHNKTPIENSDTETQDLESGISSGETSSIEDEVNESEFNPQKPKDLSYDDSGEYFKIKEVISENGGAFQESTEDPSQESEFENDIESEDQISEEENVLTEKGSSAEEKINLDTDIQEELNKYERELKEKLLEGSKEEKENSVDSEESYEPEEEIRDEQTANEEFINFENEIKSLNGKLNSEFDSLIYIITAKIDNEEERSNIINNIREISNKLELTSKDMSLEIISNIYQGIRLSFEKISKGKYDITESTLNLFKKGLVLVSNLIKGEDYFGYKNILKSIENIRKGLLEENKKREEFIRHREFKKQIDSKLDEKFPEEAQKENLIKLKKIIKDTDDNFKTLYKIEGEYKIYEALRSLSSNLNNLKETVLIAKDLKLTKMVQLAEAGYIFLKFLNSYRINPVTDDIKEIFNYLIFNMKAIIIDKEVEDQDVFISYLNDPVKIFNKIKKT